MKTMNALRIFVAVSLFTGLACSPKNQPRQVHENKREWTPTVTPDDPSVDTTDFGTFNMSKAYADLKNNDAAAQMKNILLPLFCVCFESARGRGTPLSHFEADPNDPRLSPGLLRRVGPRRSKCKLPRDKAKVLPNAFCRLQP